MDDQSATTVIEALASSLEVASRHNSGDVENPAAIVWTDHDSQWQPIIPQLRQLMPQLLTLGEYQPEQRTGPAIWLRCVVDHTLKEPKLPEGTTPILYLPGVSRQALRAVQECPDSLKPLVELQYRGVCWTQKNGKDWTVNAFLVAKDGGLGLDVAQDVATQQSMLGALTELATTSLARLRDKHLEAEDFDKLFSDDPTKDILLWLSDPKTVQANWTRERWSAFTSRCKAELHFNPDQDGEIVGAELLGRREGQWQPVWERFAESPALYPGIPELLRKAMPDELFVEPSSWPQNNEREETALRQELLALEKMSPSAARDQILRLEKTHGIRREWVWAKIDRAPLAHSLKSLAVIATCASSEVGGASVADMAKLYVDGAWQVDAAALSSMAAVKTSADTQAVSRALNAIYRPWLESAARHLQALKERESFTVRDEQKTYGEHVDSGTVILFADGLRFDVSQRLVDRLQAEGRPVTVSTHWAGLPTVTATAKPAASPVTENIKAYPLVRTSCR